MTELEKAAQKNGPEVELCEPMQRAQARVRLLKPDDFDAPELDLSDSHTALFALAEYWKGKYDKLKAQALAATEPTSASPADMQVYDKIAAGYWTERKGEPVAWRWMPSHVYPAWVYSDDQNRVADARRYMGDGGVQPLYTSPQVPEDVQKDAERLDWLEKHDGRFYNLDRISCIVGVGFIPATNPDFKAKTIREAIDAARKGE